jgi:hypothetical protein
VSIEYTKLLAMRQHRNLQKIRARLEEKLKRQCRSDGLQPRKQIQNPALVGFSQTNSKHGDLESRPKTAQNLGFVVIYRVNLIPRQYPTQTTMQELNGSSKIQREKGGNKRGDKIEQKTATPTN